MTETMQVDDAVERRAEVLRGLGAGPDEVEELLRYNANAFRVPASGGLPALPLADEDFVEAWEGYFAEAGEGGIFPVLRERLVQLRFPIREGISATEEYQAATRRGIFPSSGGEGLVLAEPERLRFFLHPTAAGRLPVLLAENRDDFVALVRAMSRRNEPDAIPPSMGACMVSGFNNWDRVARLREAFGRGERAELFGGAEDWGTAFAAVRDRRELYQDCFVLLSSGAYSGVPASAMGMDEEAWRTASVAIRLEHECAHYFTRRVLGSARNALHDELIADYAGIVAAAGRYRAGWFLRFLGLEEEGRYREGGRLQNYRGKPPVSDASFGVLQALVRRAAANVEAFDAGLGAAEHRTVEGRARVLVALASLTLEELGGEGAVEVLGDLIG